MWTRIHTYTHIHVGFLGASVEKNLPASAGDADSIPGSGRSPGGGNGSPVQYSCLENPMDRGAWGATVLWSQRVRHILATEYTHAHAWTCTHTHTHVYMQKNKMRANPSLKDVWRSGDPTHDQETPHVHGACSAAWSGSPRLR